MTMKKIVMALLVLGSFNVLSQPVKKVVIQYPKSNDVKEVYYVLKSNKAIKHGEYYAFYPGQLTMKRLKSTDIKNHILLGFKEKGQFKNNRKEGQWSYFQPPRKTKNAISYNAISEEGQYSNNERIGIWNTHVENGKVLKRFDFDTKTQLEPVIRVVPGYPAQARRNGIEGTVKVKVNYVDCEIASLILVEDIGYGCGDAVMTALKEKTELEKKYGVKKNCVGGEETLSFKFNLAD